MSENEKGFKTIDRRKENKEETNEQGEGFTVKDSPSNAPQAPEQIDFSTFVFSLATGALINLGLAPDPATKKTEKNLPLAKQNIDLLGIMQEKTKGNLTTEENQLLESLLTETRMRFVEASK